ncbi:MAG TPA: efflux RND transporter periplasmic adaptor subunit, partial [Lachnospiraceae bacterium]|nr:efflux RND transporter periplasmic adaptor subunit [Lachnospiraceae bacterium]
MNEKKNEPVSKVEDLAETKERIEKEQGDETERIILSEQTPKVRLHKGVKAQKVFKRIGYILKKLKVLIILLIIAAIAFFVYRKWKTNQEMEQAMEAGSQMETATIEKRDLTDSISTTGTVEANDTRTLTSAMSDIKITSVNAEVGDEVVEGDILVTFSDEDINRTIADLQEDIAVSEQTDEIESEAQDRDYLYTYGTEANNLSSAAEKVTDALNDVYEACDAYSSAKSDRDTAESKMEEAEATYNEKQNAVPVSANEVSAAKSAYESAVSAYESAESSVTSAYNAQVSAQQTYDSAVEGQASTTRSAANSLSSADEDYQKSSLTEGDSTEELRRKLEDYQESLSDYVVTAPISGIVTSLSVESGNGFSGGDLLTIQDCDSYKISTEIDEYDIPDIELGQEVVIKTDATRDDELEGVVSFISPTATSSSSSSGVTYSVTIDVLTTDSRLKIGMSAKLNIIVDEVTDVLTVPYDAVTENADGESVIYILDDGSMGAAGSNANMGITPDNTEASDRETAEGAAAAISGSDVTEGTASDEAAGEP